ncbi:MAG: PocR ligand-binding domain-containing protein [Candidatus Riflebacteria bacterium]|nr:PocR ligand-binding domain-containing protein [Candidatus Riflebacteria bacterium]
MYKAPMNSAFHICPDGIESDAEIHFEDLFDVEEIQRLQDKFAKACNVASVITTPEGKPITAPSNFCRLCRDIIRKTDKGNANCFRSDAIIGRPHPEGPIIQPCLSGGLWDAGAGISAGGRHIANWLIGQVRNEIQSEEKMREYAREIGADEESFIEAFREVPTMSLEQFEAVAEALFTFANQLSNAAYQNIQQARSIADRNRAENALRESEKALRQSEKRFIMALKNSPVTVSTQGLDHRFTWAYNLRTLDQATIVGKTESDIFSAEDAAKFVAIKEKVIESGIEARTQTWLKVNNKRIFLDIFFEPLRDESGKVSGIGIATVDLTRIKFAEEALAKEKLRLEKASAAGKVALWDWDISTGALEWSGIIDPMLGYDKEKFPRTIEAWKSILHPDDSQRVIDTLGNSIHNGAPVEMDYRVKRVDGKYLWLNMTGQTELDLSGGAVRMTGSCADISERKKSEQSTTLMNFALNNIHEALFLIGENGEIQLVNEEACRSLEYRNEELIGLRIEDIDPDFPSERWSSYWSELKAKGSMIFESRQRTRTDRFFPVEINSIYFEFDGRSYIFALVRDISDRKQAEAEKARLQTLLLEAQKMESIGRLAGGVAHDFNNMLCVITGFAEIALVRIKSGLSMKSDLEEILKAAKRSADLTGQLLAFARRQTISPKSLDFNETIQGTLKLLGRLIGEDIELLWVPGVDLWRVKIDTTQLDQILTNLCINARKAIEGVGRITIRTENVSVSSPISSGAPGVGPGDYVMLSLTDTGCGMDKETMEHVFEPFFTTRGAGKGAGLGLATVYGAVRQNGGFINVFSEPGKGATFRIYLPRHLENIQTEQRGAVAEPVVGGRETMLIVEDEPSILRMSAEILKEFGYKVLTAATPVEAIRIAEGNPGEIRLLVTDVIMPEMNGRDLAKRLLTMFPKLKCLFMSGYTSDVIAQRGVLEEGVHFLQKPFSSTTLAASVRKTLEIK